MVQSLRKFILNESGATAIEYALIASLIAIAIRPSLGRTHGRLPAPSLRSHSRGTRTFRGHIRLLSTGAGSLPESR
jgi:hypothetical protein